MESAIHILRELQLLLWEDGQPSTGFTVEAPTLLAALGEAVVSFGGQSCTLIDLGNAVLACGGVRNIAV